MARPRHRRCRHRPVRRPERRPDDAGWLRREQAAREAAEKAAAVHLPGFLQKILAGSAWHSFLEADAVANGLGVKELIVANGKRLDLHPPDSGEIVSLKYTQLAAIKESTALGYVKELSSKYEPGTMIASTPSVAEALRGVELVGSLILVVPVQLDGVPGNPQGRQGDEATGSDPGHHRSHLPLARG